MNGPEKRLRRIVAGSALAAAALVGAVVVATPGDAVAEEVSRLRGGPHERMQAHQERSPAQHAEHLAELAVELGVDVDVLVAMKEQLRADLAAQHEGMREQLAELDPAERQAAMRSFAEQRRELMSSALAELGLDPSAFAERMAEHGAQSGAERRAARMGDRPADGRMSAQRHGAPRGAGPGGIA